MGLCCGSSNNNTVNPQIDSMYSNMSMRVSRDTSNKFPQPVKDIKTIYSFHKKNDFIG